MTQTTRDDQEPEPLEDDEAVAKGLLRRRQMVFTEALVTLTVVFAVIGLITRRDELILLGVLSLIVSLIASVSNRHVLRRVSYTRTTDPRRAFIGETVEVTLTVENRKLLPIGWMDIEDEWPAELRIEGQEEDEESILTPKQRDALLTRRASLHNSFSLRWYERVRVHHQVVCEKRGYHRLGPAQVVSGDIFGIFRTERTLPDLDWLVVYPRVLPIEQLGLPPKDPFGETKARQRMFEDPSRTIGVRDHQPEDGFRRIHWKATARKQKLQAKVYEPSTSFTLVVFVNVATFDKYWQGTIPALLERCITVAASVSHFATEKRYVVGLVVNGCIPRSDQPITVLPGRDPQQLTRILEALAAVTPIAMKDISTLLTRESPRLSWGATLVVVTANVNEQLNSTLLRLHSAGRRLVLISLSKKPPDPLVSEKILTYHLPDAASPYYPVETRAARDLTAITRRDSVLPEWTPRRTPTGGTP